MIDRSVEIMESKFIEPDLTASSVGNESLASFASVMSADSPLIVFKLAIERVRCKTVNVQLPRKAIIHALIDTPLEI